MKAALTTCFATEGMLAFVFALLYDVSFIGIMENAYALPDYAVPLPFSVNMPAGLLQIGNPHPFPSVPGQPFCIKALRQCTLLFMVV